MGRVGEFYFKHGKRFIFVRTHTCYLSFAIAVETVTLWQETYEHVPDGHEAHTKEKTESLAKFGDEGIK